MAPAQPLVTFCVLTYGDYLPLAQRAIESIARHCPRDQYRLVVGANAVSEQTQQYLERLLETKQIDRLHLSPANINKSPMMRRIFEGIDTEFIWWLDDDSYITHPSAFATWLRAASDVPPETVMWGDEFWCYERDFNFGIPVANFVRRASWYRDKPPPSRELRPAGSTGSDNRGAEDGRWTFLTGGCWLIRTAAIRSLDWPDRRLIKHSDDVFLGEAIRQQGWNIQHVGQLGVAMDQAPTRGEGEDRATMEKQMAAPSEERK